MSIPILPFAVWQSGTNENSLPANDNSLRHQILNGMVLGVSDNSPGTEADGDIYIVGSSPTGEFATFDENDLTIYMGGTWYAFAPVEGIVVNLNEVLKQWDGAAYVDAATGGGGGAVSSVNGDTGAVIVPVPIGIACSDESTNLTTGTAKATFRMPFAMTLTSVRASLSTAQSTGSIFTVDINEAGASILSTKLTIDNTEKTSVTAATPPVISDSALADDAEITIDIDQVGTAGAKGLKVWLIGYPA